MVFKGKDTVPNTEDFTELRNLVTHHIQSFDYMTEKGLDVMFNRINPVFVNDPSSDNKWKIWLENPKVFSPQKESLSSTSRKESLFPFECRQAKISYTGAFMADVCFSYDNGLGGHGGGLGAVVREKFEFGELPIMLMSNRCHLQGADCRKLLKCKESTSEMGGYFILNGIERVFRCVIAPKRNHPTGMIRNSFTGKREGYSDKAVAIRCVRDDQSAVTIKVYYNRNGSARVGFWIGGREYLLPVGLVLKALTETNDEEIYESLNCCYNEHYGRGEGSIGTQLVRERAKIILDEVRDLGLFTREQCRKYLGEHFKSDIDGLENDSYLTVAAAVLKNYIFVHLDNDDDKFNLLIFIIQKLFSLVDQTSLPDNPDSLQNQEILVPGHLITIYLKEKLEEWLRKCKSVIEEEMRNVKSKFDFENHADIKKLMNRNLPRSIGTSIESLLKSGCMATRSSLDLQQKVGYTVQAERLNFLRFLSFFRAVHRGASFAGLRTTTVRKLLPESWGFLCPVHTPDGEPCGLLNHMTRTCRISSQFDSNGNIRDFVKIKKSVVDVLVGVGMIPSLPKLVRAGPPKVIPVLLDGQVVGSLASNLVTQVVAYLRRLKVEAPSIIPEDLEVGYVPTSMGGSYPGLYLASCPARFIRPVKNTSIPSNNIELIGPFEQVFMEISCPDGGNGGRNNSSLATHEEIDPTGMISVVANLTPWSDHNQSPRNMYQCQMAKQTMAYSTQALQFRADQKIYHLQTPQSPVVRTKTYTKYNIDENPTGTNAIVAVLAHTGFDMEDAMILNKSSVERGMCHGQIYQTEAIDLSDQKSRSGGGNKRFRRSNVDKSDNSCIDADGLPYVGQKIYPGQAYCTVYDEVTGEPPKPMKRKGTDPVIVDFVSLDMKSKNHPQKANIRFRHARNPIIGDKFSSRHGQKGVCSQLWPDIDMPFNGVTGMRPDLIINPHAFPSRMTIAMLLESIAAKGGSLRGEFVDATPFRDAVKKTKGEEESESSLLVDDLGSMLKQKGFNHYGTETLYSGYLGVELKCEIFIGPVYYQRLRHMVSDKFQVRSTGAVDQLTHQPIKGRKRGGGIRFGEMERDSLLAHGASYLLHDRLHTSSDHHIADVCSLCGSLLTSSVLNVKQKKLIQEIGKLPPGRTPKKVTCESCKTSKGMETVAMPYVFRYLAAELASMNIKMTLQLSNNSEGSDSEGV